MIAAKMFSSPCEKVKVKIVSTYGNNWVSFFANYVFKLRNVIAWRLCVNESSTKLFNSVVFHGLLGDYHRELVGAGVVVNV